MILGKVGLVRLTITTHYRLYSVAMADQVKQTGLTLEHDYVRYKRARPTLPHHSSPVSCRRTEVTFAVMADQQAQPDLVSKEAGARP